MSLFIETIRIIDGKAFNIDLHNQRLNSTRLHFFGKIAEINIDNMIDPIKNLLNAALPITKK